MISMKCGGVPVGYGIRIAATFWSRFRGLMFQKSLPEGSGLLIMPCGSIHMCFMRMALDIVYLDAGFRVMGVQAGLRPWRLGALIKGTKMVLELPGGTIARCGIRPGIMLAVGAQARGGEALMIDEARDCYGIETAG